jgi:predicted ATPase
MQIRKIIIKNLYGYINKQVDFNDEINLLVGINGSGKTSVLNLINWLLKPSIAYLCVTEFEEVQLLFQFKKGEYKIVSKQNKTELTIDLENLTSQKKFNQIQATFKIHPSEITKNQIRKDEFFSGYSSLGPDIAEVETWNFLYSTLPHPIIIGLDRYLYTEEGDEVRFTHERKLRMSSEEIINKTPLLKVMELTRRSYSVYRNRIINLNVRLNNKIMLSSFDEIYNEDNIVDLLNAKQVTLSQVEMLQDKVMKYFEENKIFKRDDYPNRTDSALKKIESYFINLKKIIKDAEIKKKSDRSLNILYLTNINQFKKIGNLIKEFEDFENSFKAFEKPIKEYLNSVNDFFKDSSKQLYFERDSSELRFNILDKNKKIVASRRDIRTLSSGEQQILILLTYLKFYSTEGKLFIIDEPELSLHPKWQDDFLNQIIKVAPKGTQIIIATHSPAIVGKHEDFCKILLPYN